MSPRNQGDVPSAIYADCPTCADETLHTVLKGSVGHRGGYVLDATVSCTQCKHVHHVVVREAPDREVPIIVSEGEESWRSRITLAADEEVEAENLLTVDERPVLVTSLETTEGRRVTRARVADVGTVWAKAYDKVTVKFAINLGHKTISKDVPAEPTDEYRVDEEYTFGRLRVTVHAIKTQERLLRRGSAPAGEIVRVFAKPTPPDRKQYRPPPEVRARMAARQREQEHWSAESDEIGVGPRTRAPRASRAPRGSGRRERPTGRGGRFGGRGPRGGKTGGARGGRGRRRGDDGHEEENA